MSFYLILDQAKIQKKYEFLSRAEVKFYSFVADDQLSLPGLDQLLSTANPDEVRANIEEMRPRVRAMAKTIVSKWESVQINNVRANHVFGFGDTGKVLFRANRIPDFIDWIMLVIEIDEDVRELGAKLDDFITDDEIDDLSRNVLKLAGAVATPQYMAAVAIGKFVMKKTAAFMKENKNDQLGLVEQSFTREMHYPLGKRQVDGTQDLTGNMWYDYTIFGLDE